MEPPRTLRLATSEGDRDLVFSHVISTPLGNFAVFADPDSDFSAVLKLVEPPDEELKLALDFWAEMGRELGGDGFPLWLDDDEDDEGEDAPA